MNDECIREALARFATPFYLFDEAELNSQVRHVAALLPNRVQLCYAMKANPFVLPWASRAVGPIEVCSEGEYRICQAVGVPDEQVVITGVVKDEDFVRHLVRNHPCIARYTAESPRQFDMIERAAAEVGAEVPVMLRLTSGNQFGMDRAEVMGLIGRMAAGGHARFAGVQYFSGTQKASNDKHRRELKRLDRLIAAIREERGVELPELEYGGGLPVEYFGEDRDAARASEDAVVAGLGRLVDAMDYQGPVTMELGRALAASCGTYVTRVVDAKVNKGSNIALVDGGMHQIVYFGHAMALHRPLCHALTADGRSIGPGDGEPEHLWSIYGSLCTANDVLAKQLPLEGLDVGSVIVFEKAGAYCMTEGMSLFLSRDLPRVVLRGADGELRLARDRVETFDLNTPAH